MKRAQVGAVVVVAVLVAVFWNDWSQPSVQVIAPSHKEFMPTGDLASSNIKDSIAERLQQLRTFRGASQDGALRTDHRNNLVVDMQLRHWIDFHLTAQGELSLDEIVELMHLQIQQLPEPGQRQAFKILSDYLGYLGQVGVYDEEMAKRLLKSGVSEVEARILWQQRLRREWLEPHVVEAFFAGDEDIDLYTLEQQKLRHAGANQDELAALEITLPEPIRVMRKESRQLLTMATAERELKEQGATDVAIQNWRIQEYGAEAAERLAVLDKKHNDWQQRLQLYQQYQQSPALEHLEEADKQKLLHVYQKKHFSLNEQKRLQAALQLLANES